ncbi:hypothetical protein C8R44DRAFT_864127 [Mycena epipterygia]|nr:hypothetical protein C8R44DRAFT_864127 [Mycena epipterygia]
MTEALLPIFLFFATLIQLAVCLPIVERLSSDDLNRTSEALASASGLVSASPLQAISGSSSWTRSIAPGVTDVRGVNDTNDTSASSASGLVLASDFPAITPLPVPQAGGLTFASAYPITTTVVGIFSSIPTTTTEAGGAGSGIGISDTHIFPSTTTIILVPITSAGSPPSSGTSIPSPPASPTVTAGQSAQSELPPESQFTGTSTTIPPLTPSPSSSTASTFGENVHVSNSETLSPSTSIFTTLSFSTFITNGQVRSTAVPVVSTSVTLVPVPTPTSVQTASRTSSGPGTKTRVGVALGGVALLLVLVLVYIINRRRDLRNRAFLRLGEELNLAQSLSTGSLVARTSRSYAGTSNELHSIRSAFFSNEPRIPTDYDDPSAGTSKLALTNYRATCPESERLGIIITNYGGPGVSGRDASFGYGPRLQNLTGNKHDIISFDQRGLGHSFPKVNCFGSALKYELFSTNTVFETTFSVPKNPFSAEGRAILVEQQKEALALEETQGALCAETMGAETLGFMSTTTTVYDMEEISRVLVGGDALINFWGGSYGSLVGAYLGNMLPHKAGKIVIDGIAPGDMWSNVHYDSQALLRLFLTDSEKTYQLYLTECFNAGPDHCALSNLEDTSPADIEQRINDFIDRLQVQPMRVINHPRPGYLTSGGVRSTFFNMLQMTDMWVMWAEILARAINDSDGAPILRFVAPEYSEPAPAPDHDGYVETGQVDLMRLAISCGDARAYRPGEKWPTAEEIVDNILVTLETYPRFGATVHLMEQHGGCHFWPGTGVGPQRFTGPFNKTLATPTLIVANTRRSSLPLRTQLNLAVDDPITPYAIANTVHNTMGDSSRLLLQGTAGHSYLAPTTACAAEVIRRYFADGVIPEASETRCEREVENFFIDNDGLDVNPKVVPGSGSGF